MLDQLRQHVFTLFLNAWQNVLLEVLVVSDPVVLRGDAHMTLVNLQALGYWNLGMLELVSLTTRKVKSENRA